MCTAATPKNKWASIRLIGLTKFAFLQLFCKNDLKYWTEKCSGKYQTPQTCYCQSSETHWFQFPSPVPFSTGFYLKSAVSWLPEHTSDVALLLDRLQRGSLHEELHQLGADPLLVGVARIAGRVCDTGPGSCRKNKGRYRHLKTRAPGRYI